MLPDFEKLVPDSNRFKAYHTFLSALHNRAARCYGRRLGVRKPVFSI